MKNIYIVFDKLHSDESGGLLAVYASFYHLFRNEYDIKVISVINSGVKHHSMFPNCEILNISKKDFFPNIEKLTKSLKTLNILSCINELFKLFCYFCFIPISRKRMRNRFTNNDIIIVSSPAAGMFMSKKNKFILEIHSKFEYFWGNNKLGNLQRRIMVKPELTIFRTKSDMNKALKLFPSTYNYNCIDSSITNSKKSIGKKKREHKIIFVGRFVQSKNLNKMLSAAKKLKIQVPDFCLDMYGTGPLVEEIKKLILEYDLNENVHLCGFTKDKTIYDNYAIQWLTSDYEGFGLVIIEAKANGVPTISTNWGDGVYEVIHNGEDGYIEDTEDEIVNKTIELFQNKKLLNKVSNAALNNSIEFSEEKAYKRWKRILNQFEKEDLQ